MDRKESRALLKKANELKDKIATLFCEADIEVGLVLTVLTAMTVDTALNQAEIPPHELIRMLASSVCKAQEVIEDQRDEEEEEDDEQTISRTTH